jgi:phosphoglycolate phosphatase
VETLDALAQAGAALSICTNKPQVLADPLIDALGLTPLFRTIVGVTPDRPSKPHAAQALLCLERSRAQQPGRSSRKIPAVFIGDSDTDILTAEAIGAPCLLASFGYGPTSLLAKTAGAFNDYRDLPRCIASAIGGR